MQLLQDFTEFFWNLSCRKMQQERYWEDNWEDTTGNLMQGSVTFSPSCRVSRRQGRGVENGFVWLVWSPGCCLDKSRFLYLLPGWAYKCKYLQLQMCPFIIEQERATESFCQRIEIIKEAISDVGKKQAVTRGSKGVWRRQNLFIYSSETQLKPQWRFLGRTVFSLLFHAPRSKRIMALQQKEVFHPSFSHLIQSLWIMNPQGTILLLHQHKPETSRLLLGGWLWCKAWREVKERSWQQNRADLCKFSHGSGWDQPSED